MRTVKFSDDEIIKLALKLAIQCEIVLSSNALNLSERLNIMKGSLDNFHEAIEFNESMKDRGD